MNFFTFTFEEQKKQIGKNLGTSDWILITQEMTNSFGAVTQDLDPMHIDPEWCKKYSPYEGTISFGFQTISMLTRLFHPLIRYEKDSNVGTGGYPLNYGFDRLRLTGPVPVNSRIRGHFTLKDVQEREAGKLIQTVSVEVEVEGHPKPALVADWLFVWVTEAGHDRISKKIPSCK